MDTSDSYASHRYAIISFELRECAADDYQDFQIVSRRGGTRNSVLPYEKVGPETDNVSEAHN